MPPTTNESDSGDDLDYVPSADDHDSDISDEQDHIGHTAETAAPPETDPSEKKKQRDALWASFQASVFTPRPSSSASSQLPSEAKRVKIEKTYLFAGKHVTDVLEVPEDSEEAKKWPRWSPHPRLTSEPAPASTLFPEKGQGEDKDKGDNSSPPPPPPPGIDPSSAAPTTPTFMPGVKRPGPRRPRTMLPSIPKASQAKKITTLDKSTMDWRAHVASQSSDVKDALDANRRGGGYLEKVDFLKRVQDRREDAFEASKSSKRRKT